MAELNPKHLPLGYNTPKKRYMVLFSSGHQMEVQADGLDPRLDSHPFFRGLSVPYINFDYVAAIWEITHKEESR